MNPAPPVISTGPASAYVSWAIVIAPAPGCELAMGIGGFPRSLLLLDPGYEIIERVFQMMLRLEPQHRWALPISAKL